MPVALINEDEVSRCIIYARAFSENVHIDELLWRFESTQSDGASHESAVLRRLAPLEADVHRIGCAIAEHQNIRNSSTGSSRRYYCGFRSARYDTLPTEGDGYTIAVTNVPEGGEDAHLDVALTISVTGKSAKAQRRTDAGLALAEQFGPPTPHICECDKTDGDHPINRWGLGCLSAVRNLEVVGGETQNRMRIIDNLHVADVSKPPAE